MAKLANDLAQIQPRHDPLADVEPEQAAREALAPEAAENRATRRAAGRSHLDAQVATLDEIRAAGATVSLELAARALWVCRSTAYTMIRNGEFPVPVIKVGGSRYRIPQAALLRLLCAESQESA